MSVPSREKTATRAVRGGLDADPRTGALVPPIHQSTTFAHEAVGRDRGFTYSRAANPTVEALEKALAHLEEARHAVVFRSGMAALTSLVMGLVRSGDTLVCGRSVYGGTARLLNEILAPFGVSIRWVDAESTDQVRMALDASARLLLVESPSNPTLRVCDLAALSALAHEQNCLFAVDNTFMTPILQRPFEFGADVVVYSTTKYIDGHNATLGGALLLQDTALDETLRWFRKAVGNGQAPFEAWLTLQGLKTLPVRMRRQCASAARIAAWLEDDARIEDVFYPGLASHDRYPVATVQQDSGGAMIACTVRGGIEAARCLMNELRLWTLAENLGAVQSLVTHPATMTHGDLGPAGRAAAGIPEGLVRLSVGLEDPDDLIADLHQALARATKRRTDS